MHIKPTALFILLLIIGMGSLSCAADNGNGEKESADGEFPIPWPEGGEIITDLREEGDTIGSVTLRYDNDRYQEVVEFYDDYTDEDGWNRTEQGQGEVPGINYMNLMEGLNISVGPPNGQIADAFLVTLMVS